MSTALTQGERGALAKYEELIERGLESFIEVGNALLRVRNERLYRTEFGTFQEYCEARWGMSRVHAHRMIEAAEVAENLLPNGNKPSSEGQIRPLVSLPADKQREAWKEAIKSSDGKPTAKDVEAAVQRIEPSRSADTHRREPLTEILSLLQAYWGAASKSEKKQFKEWIKNNE